MILDDSQWFTNHSQIIFWVILSDLQISLKLFWANSQWFSTILSDSQTTLKSFLGDSQWFVNQSEIVLAILSESWWFSVILDDSQWFMNQSEIVLGLFLMILGDSEIFWAIVSQESFAYHHISSSNIAPEWFIWELLEQICESLRIIESHQESLKNHIFT